MEIAPRPRQTASSKKGDTAIGAGGDFNFASCWLGKGLARLAVPPRSRQLLLRFTGSGQHGLPIAHATPGVTAGLAGQMEGGSDSKNLGQEQAPQNLPNAAVGRPPLAGQDVRELRHLGLPYQAVLRRRAKLMRRRSLHRGQPRQANGFLHLNRRRHIDSRWPQAAGNGAAACAARLFPADVLSPIGAYFVDLYRA